MGMNTKKEPVFFLKNGEPNPEWLRWYMDANNCSTNQARYDWWAKLRMMEEPIRATTSGAPSPIWVSWWRAHKACSRNIAVAVCKAKINGTYIPNKKMTEWLAQKNVSEFLSARH